VEDSAAAPRVTPPGAAPSAEDESRFRTLVQSPLRAGLLRFLNTRPQDTFEVDLLMSAFGRMRMDVDNCLRELVDSGLVQKFAGPPDRFAACQPAGPFAAQ
jgi:hypothetical protein